MKNIEILYEDEFIIIINKPAGLAVQGGKGVKTSLDSLLTQFFKEENRSQPPLLVHRLDKDTSGILLVAKGHAQAARFSALINEKKTVKQYIAVCSGLFSPEKTEGVITDELEVHGAVKNSETRYRVIESGRPGACEFDYSVLELELGTGRMHQIRRHLAMNKSPILGDDKYGDFSLNKKLRKEAGLKKLLLHARRLEIKNSMNIDITAKLPDYFNPYVHLP